MSTAASYDFSPPAGELARLIAEKNWTQTSIGPRKSWPRRLDALVETVIAQPIPMIVLWGPDLVQIYNDGYRIIAHDKHPLALGQPTHQCWPEVAEFTAPLYERVLRGESFSMPDQRLVLQRQDKPAEAFITLSFGPARGDDGKICGVLAVLTETTSAIVAERTRRRMEEQRQLALSAGRMGWWHLNIGSRRIFWDERMREIYGQSGDEIEYEKILAMILPEDTARVAATVRASLNPADPKPYFVEYRFHHPDGSIHWMRSTGQASFEGEGAEKKPVGIYGTAIDVTSTKQAEAESAENVERLNLALAAGDLGDWSWDPLTDRMTLSPRAADMFGLPHGEPITRTDMRLLIAPEHREAAKAALERAVAERVDYDSEYRVDRKDGKPVWIAARGRSVLDAQGKITRMLGVVQDITRSRELLHRIETERGRLSLALMQSPAFMCVLRGPQHVIEFANDKYYQLIGRRDVVGKPIREALPEVATQGYFEILDGVLKTGQPFVGRDLQVDLVRTPGAPAEKVDVDFVFQPLGGPEGAMTGILVHGIDITENKRVQLDRERLFESERAARAEAERASRMKDEFLATVSHELRTPLSAILGWTQVLKEVGPAIDLNEALETIERNARAQAQIVEDLLDMSRIISGKLRLDVQVLDLTEVIRAGLETARPAAEAKGVKLVSVLDPRTGPLKGDPSRLQQVVWNLLSNAIKFTPKGGRVQIALERINSHVEINVADTGAGVAPEFLPFVFDRFRQSDSSSTRRHGGLGLGLAIVKQLVELHGGSVRAKSLGLGQGSTFTVVLPLMVAQTEPTEGPERRHPKSGAAPPINAENIVRLNGIRVLAVDDEPDTRSFIRRLLENHGAYVTTAESAADAMKKLKEEQFDVLVSDIGMPREDGYELIRQVRALPARANGSIPALALTAYARSEDRMRAIRAGFQMHLTKPVENVELLTMVASLGGVRQ